MKLLSLKTIIFSTLFLAIILIYLPYVTTTNIITEGSRVAVAIDDVATIIQPDYIIEPAHPPLIYLIYNTYFRFFENITDTSILALNFVLFITKILTIFIVSYKLFNFPVAIFGMTLAASNKLVPFYLDNINNFNLFNTLLIITIWLIYEIYTKKKEYMKKYLILVNILLVWTNFFSFFFILSQFIFIISREKMKFIRKNNIKYILIFLIGGFIPIARFILSVTQNTLQRSSEEVSAIFVLNHAYHQIGGTFYVILLLIGFIIFLIMNKQNTKYKIILFYFIGFSFAAFIMVEILNYNFYSRYNYPFIWIIAMISSASLILIKNIVNKLFCFKKERMKKINHMILSFALILSFSNLVIAQQNITEYEERDRDYNDMINSVKNILSNSEHEILIIETDSMNVFNYNDLFYPLSKDKRKISNEFLDFFHNNMDANKINSFENYKIEQYENKIQILNHSKDYSDRCALSIRLCKLGENTVLIINQKDTFNHKILNELKNYDVKEFLLLKRTKKSIINNLINVSCEIYSEFLEICTLKY